VVVADDEPDTGETTLHEAAHEARPGRALVVARGELESEDAPLPAGGHPDRDEGGHRDHATTLADLEVRGVEPEVGVALTAEWSGPEGLDLGVEGGALAADLALQADPEGPTRSSTRRVETPST
jgi:hypothetical protein